MTEHLLLSFAAALGLAVVSLSNSPLVERPPKMPEFCGK